MEKYKIIQLLTQFEYLIYRSIKALPNKEVKNEIADLLIELMASTDKASSKGG